MLYPQSLNSSLGKFYRMVNLNIYLINFYSAITICIKKSIATKKKKHKKIILGFVIKIFF